MNFSFFLPFFLFFLDSFPYSNEGSLQPRNRFANLHLTFFPLSLSISPSLSLSFFTHLISHSHSSVMIHRKEKVSTLWFTNELHLFSRRAKKTWRSHLEHRVLVTFLYSFSFSSSCLSPRVSLKEKLSSFHEITFLLQSMTAGMKTGKI